ncbi:MAG: lipid-A-disaccharide synthase [Cohaesibacteraceae bacterium]|nr:lipid-A-disaccharide synthase [Cohaesibacteraceae bacterium]
MSHQLSRIEKPLRIYIVVGEDSGDQLGVNLLVSLRKLVEPRKIEFFGIAGDRMKHAGLSSLFPLSDIAVMGLSAIIWNFPRIYRRANQIIDDIVAIKPDVLIIIDSPDFTQPVARRAKRRLNGNLKVVKYVSPSVWAWRPGRAKKMSGFVNHILALLPFEPDVHKKLNGPPCTYVGHPLIEQKLKLRGSSADKKSLEDAPVLVVLPGSRSGEVTRLMPVFGEVVARLKMVYPNLEILLPCVSHQKSNVLRLMSFWPVQASIIEGESGKWQAFRSAHAALAASGTVTLELAIAHVPTVVAYKLDWLANKLKFLVNVPSFVLANLVLGKKVMPEFLDEKANCENLFTSLKPLLVESDARNTQLLSLQNIDLMMELENDQPSMCAGKIVLREIGSLQES